MAFHILSLILFHLLLASEQTAGFRATLTRKEYTTTSIANEATASLVKYSMKAYKDLHIMSLAVGTPPTIFSGVMDTGSDLIWKKCSQFNSFFKIEESCADLGLNEDCIQSYPEVKVHVTLGQENLAIGNDEIQNLTLACGTVMASNNNFPFDGIVGMGRGKLSLVSQLEVGVFLYCLGSRSDPTTTSVLLAGSRVNIQDTNIQTMPLLTREDSYYYISLEGISVGEIRLPVRKSDFATGNGGMIIDSGTTFTYLERRIIDMINNTFMSQTMLETSEDGQPQYDDLEYCFKLPGTVPVPTLVFHFEGADWELPKENYIYQKDGEDVACLAFIANDHDPDGLSILGNMQQQNMMVIYDLDRNSLSFGSADCNQL